MGNQTETPRGERLVRIFGHLVRNKSRKFCVQEILDFLGEDETVSLLYSAISKRLRKSPEYQWSVRL